MIRKITNLAFLGIRQVSPSLYFYSKLTNEINFTKEFNERMEQITTKTPGNFIRLKVSCGGGCGGFSYKFSMDNKANDNDLAYLIKDKIYFACDDFTLQLVKGCKLDFVDTGLSQTFKVVSNPNAKFSCHCQNTFNPSDDILKKIKK